MQLILNIFEYDCVINSPDLFEAPYKDIGLSTQTGSTYNRIIGAIVMYDYMMNHADDIIVSINAGTSAQKQFPMYHTRYARIGQGGMGLKETVNLMKDKGWYNFKIQPAATKFTLGATK